MGVIENGLAGQRHRARGTRKAEWRVRSYAALATADALSIVGGMAVASLLRTDDAFSDQTVGLLAVLLPAFATLAISNRAYGVDVLTDWRLGARRTLYTLIHTALIALGLAFALKVTSNYSRLAIGAGLLMSATSLVVSRYGIGTLVRRSTGGALYEEVVLCDDPTATLPAGVPVIDAQALGLMPTLDSPMMLDRLGRALRTADRVVVACPPTRRGAWASALKGLGRHVEVTVPEIEDLGLLALGRFDGRVTAVVARGPLGARDELLKRAFDVAFTAAAMPILLAVSACVALAILLEDGGPVIFAQTRMGRGNRLFRLYKFRSMRVADADPSGGQSTRRRDARVTRVGRLLRATSLDELPQFLNVLRGEMSIVGPRPHALGSTAADALFWEVDNRYWLRHAAKPGLTGLAQIRGFRGATCTVADLTNRVQADLEYLSGWTLRRDLRILFATAGVLLHPNAY